MIDSDYSRFSHTIISYLIITALLVFSSQGICEWGRTADDYLRLRIGDRSVMCSDLNGGCWIAANPIGLCHVDKLGNVTWGENHFYFDPAINFSPKLVPVDTNSVIIAMQRYNEEQSKIYLNRITKEQEFLWGQEGIALDNSNRPQYIDGAYGIYPGPLQNTFLVHWQRDRDEENEYRRVQLINTDGELLWGEHGIGLPGWGTNMKILATSDDCVIAVHPVESYPASNPLVEIIKFNAEGQQVWQERYAINLEEYPTFRGWALCDVEQDRDGGVILATMYKRGSCKSLSQKSGVRLGLGQND